MIGTFLVLAATLQAPEEPVVRLQRALEEKLRSSGDAEVRRRAGDLREFLRDRIVTVLSGGPAPADDAPVLGFHDPRTLMAPIQDRPFPAFWTLRLDGVKPAGGPLEPLQSPIGEEQIVDLIKERVAPGTWEGDRTIEKTPAGMLLIQAPPSVQRAVARFLRVQEAETRLAWRVSVELFALQDPRPAGLAVPRDGVLEEDSLRKLEELAAGDRARRAGGFELSAPHSQLVSAFSGREVEIVVGHEEAGPRRVKVLDGLCVELMALPAGEGLVQARVRLGYRKLLGVEEVATARGPVQSPRFAETGFDEEVRMLRVGAPCMLGLLGPLPEEAKLPPYLLAVARFSPR